VPSDKLRIKAESTPGYEYNFAHSFGGIDDDIVTSLSLSDNGLYHFVSGYFSGEMNIGSYKLVSKGKEDIFIAKYDNEGNVIWAKSAGSLSFDDRAYGVTSDYDGYIYVTGVTYNGVVFDNSAPQLAENNVPYFFVAKYNSTGQYVNSRFIGATSEFKDFKTQGTKIGFEYKLGNQPRIMLEGLYSGEYIEYNLNVSLPYEGTQKPFSVALNTNLEPTEMYVGKKNWDYSGKEDDYINQDFYKTDNFIQGFKIDRFNLSSNGKNDFWISKYSKIAQSIDITGTFSLIKQEPKLTNNKFSFGELVYGDSVTATITKTLYNPYQVPVEITGYFFDSQIGTDFKNDYSLVSDIVGKKINPSDSIDLQIKFKPNFTGPRNAWLNISSSCADYTKLELYGTGVCGGKALDVYDFGKQNLKKARKDTIKCAFQNVSNVKLVIEPLVRGTNFKDFSLEIPDYYVVTNGRIDVEPNQCIDLIVTFNPSEIGDRVANINYNIEKPCKNSIMEIRGTGISADVNITSYNWGEKRVKGTYSSKLQINNNSEGKEIIDSIKFVDPNYDNYFNLNINSNDYPMPINPNSLVEVDVEYQPILEQTDGAEIYCYINSRTEPLTAKLDGIGILPKMIVNWDCGVEVNIGDSTIATLSIENPSQSAVLKINEINFETIKEEFTFINPADLIDRTLDKGDKITIPVMFKPKANSTNSNVINIFADDYDGTFTEEWKLTKVDANCDGIELIYSDKDFGNTIVCSNNEYNLIIKNSSKSKDVTLYLDQASFSDFPDLFKIKDTKNIVVVGGQEVMLPISFQSKELGNFATKLNIPNSANYKVEIEIKGSALNYTPSATLTTANLDVSNVFTYPLEITIPNLQNDKIESIKLLLKYDPYVIKYLDNTLKSNLTNWSWTSNYLGNGELELTGNGTLGDNQTIKALSIDFVVLLNDKHKTEISATTVFDCNEYDYNLSVINSNLVCFNDNRIVLKMSSSQFILKDINPNPIVESSKIEFGVGFDVDVKIEILNMNGEKIETLIDDKLPAGYFEATLNTKNISSGIYFVKMVAGPYTEIKKVILIK